MVYDSLFFATLKYGIIAWGGAYQNVMQHVEILNKRIIKTILNLPQNFPSTSLYKETNLLDLKQTFCQNSMLLMIRNNEIDKMNGPVRTRAKRTEPERKHQKKIHEQRTTLL